jgi:beta-1,2-rhamnosyltransferase WsaF-like protein/glycosyl transferase family 2
VTADGDLHVHLDAPLPAQLAVGAGTALLIAGWCARPSDDVGALRMVVDGDAQPLLAQRMPRLDVHRMLGYGYRSGFWGIATVAAGEGPYTIDLAAEDGAVEPLARMSAVAPPARVDVAPPAPAAGPVVAICMATYDPAPELLERQLESIRAQTHANWVCVISDDCSRPERFAALEAAVAGDPRFAVSRSSERLGFYANFERAMGLAPAAADFVALADQDDAWYPEKLATLLTELGHARLVYSDARIIDREGAVRADSYWQQRRNNHTDLLSLLVANSVTGAASLFPRDLLDDALPFPPAQFTHFHDHWLGLTALATGDIAFVDRPLYDYVQHGDASLGHAAANRVTALRDRVGNLRCDPRERVRMWRMHYFVDVLRIMQFATVLRLRCADRMAPEKRQAVDEFLAADRSLATVARLWGRGAREVSGRRTETLGAEWTLAYALTWRRALAATASTRGPESRLRLDAVPPTSLRPRPRRRGPGGTARTIADKIAPLELAVRDDAPARINVLVPTIDLEHFFGGYIAKFNLARRLAERGLRVRIVTVDPVPPLPRDWRARVEAYEGLAGLFGVVQVAFGREANGLEVGREDRFVASTWWSAHVAAAAAAELNGERFVYLIQEYEPFTFPMGTYAALAAGSYRLPHYALFSTELLRDYFRRHGLGVYADDREAGDRDSASFQNAITAVPRPDAAELAERTSRRLLFYARPEPHAARNMFELGVLALSRALDDGVLEGWELRGIGARQRGGRIDLGGGARLELLRRADQRAYAELLREHDVGLALMYTPHPSLVPIEMASAGMLTVSNSFDNKTPDALAAISPNLVAAEVSVEAIAAKLGQAVAGVGDVERRVLGSDVQWSRDWDTSFDDALLARVAGWLTA